jgi:hypothetical protein
MNIEKDKLLHIVISAIIMVLLGLILPTWAAALTTLCVGIGKEIYDKVSGKGCPELMDIVYNCIGILIGIL